MIDTLLDIKEKTKNNIKAMLDLKNFGIYIGSNRKKYKTYFVYIFYKKK